VNLYRAIGSIGGLTLVSRVLGFARDMIGSRVLGASHANDAFNLAFLLPNIFRRLFAEGAFSSGFVPLFSRRLAAGGHEDAQAFSNEILSVFMPALLLVTVIFEILMPGVILLVAGEYQKVPGKYELAVELTRWTFPYLLFISLVALLSGVLNSLMRFAIAAFAPALLNISLIIALIVAPTDKIEVVRYMSIAVLAGGIAQFALCWAAVRQAGVRLYFGRPRLTPAVKELVVLILPATAAAGVYQISQLFYAYFATGLQQGSLVYLSQADRLNQLPLRSSARRSASPSFPRSAATSAPGKNARPPTSRAGRSELAMLLTIPAAVALSVAADPIMTVPVPGRPVSRRGGCAVSAMVLSILVAGLPAYVMIKVWRPAFTAGRTCGRRSGSPSRRWRPECRPISFSSRSSGSRRSPRPPPGRRGSMPSASTSSSARAAISGSGMADRASSSSCSPPA
jgi:putative peptidoglycan lipid II flippase